MPIGGCRISARFLFECLGGHRTDLDGDIALVAIVLLRIEVDLAVRGARCLNPEPEPSADRLWGGIGSALNGFGGEDGSGRINDVVTAKNASGDASCRSG